MYNLLISGNEEAWESGNFELEKSRFLEYTKPHIAEKFTPLSSYTDTLLEFPCLFAYEGNNKPYRIGWLTKIEDRGRRVYIEFRFDEEIQPIPFETIEKVSTILDIQDWEINRTHWAIKDGNLLYIFRDIKMHIAKVKITNFKSIKDLEIEFNPTFNVIIGQNNCGKTTIIEAMQLWKKCFDANITAKGDKFYSNARNIPFRDFEFLRIADDKDMFNILGKKNKADINISFILKENNEEFDLGFTISRVGHVENSYYQISYMNKEEFIRFTEFTINKGKLIKNMLAFSDTRPISNIVIKEPYMYMAQIRSKMQKGKGYEVLRNKIIRRDDVRGKIEEYASVIFDKKVKFKEKDKDNREYIKLFVDIDGKENDILSQGSGFLQVADIFSSFEFSDSLVYVLLIDEPDAHIHIATQQKLIEQFRNIERSQIFIITHNEKFIEKVTDNEIIFVNEIDKEAGHLKPLVKGAKKFVIENLVGEYSDIERLKNAEKILLVEGFKDKKRINLLLEKYVQINGKECGDIYIIDLQGIDSVNEKLTTIINAYNTLIQREITWILLRDTDCVPQSKIEEIKGVTLKYIHCPNKEIIFQNGYELESSLFSEDAFIVSLLSKYYNISPSIIGGVFVNRKLYHISLENWSTN